MVMKISKNKQPKELSHMPTSDFNQDALDRERYFGSVQISRDGFLADVLSVFVLISAVNSLTHSDLLIPVLVSGWNTAAL